MALAQESSVASYTLQWPQEIDCHARKHIAQGTVLGIEASVVEA